MRQFLFIVTPIILAVFTFTGFSFFLSQNGSGRGALQVTSVPLSNVYLNGKFIGKTPLCKCEGKDLLPTGEYTLKLIPFVGDNIDAYEQRVTITKSILTVVDRTFGTGSLSSGFTITLTPVTDKNMTELFVSSFPSGASVSIDQNDSGTTPLLLKSITPSDHDIIVTKSGYKTKTVHIQTHPGYQLNAVVYLGLLPPDSSSSSAALDNQPLTPQQKQIVRILNTPTGFLRVRTEPSLTGSEAAQVKPGETFEMTDEQDGWYQIKLPNGDFGWVSNDYAQKE